MHLHKLSFKAKVEISFDCCRRACYKYRTFRGLLGNFTTIRKSRRSLLTKTKTISFANAPTCIRTWLVHLRSGKARADEHIYKGQSTFTHTHWRQVQMDTPSGVSGRFSSTNASLWRSVFGRRAIESFKSLDLQPTNRLNLTELNMCI